MDPPRYSADSECINLLALLMIFSLLSVQETHKPIRYDILHPHSGRHISKIYFEIIINILMVEV